MALVNVKGKALSQEKYTGEIGGQAVEFQKVTDTMLGFYIPNLASGVHMLKGSIEGVQGSLTFDIESFTSVANPAVYTDNFVNDLLTQIDVFIVELAGGNPALTAKLQSIRDELASNQIQLGTLSASDQQLLADLIYINFRDVQSATAKLATKGLSVACSGRFDQAGYNLAKLTALIATFAVTLPAATTLVGAIVPGIAAAMALQTANTFIITDVPAVYDVCFTSTVKEVSAGLKKSSPEGLRKPKAIIGAFVFEDKVVKPVEFTKHPNSFTESLVNKLLGLPLVSTYYTQEITIAVMPKIDDPSDYGIYPSIMPLTYTISETPDAGHLTAKLIQDPTQEVDFDLKFKNTITQQDISVRAKLMPTTAPDCTYGYTDGTDMNRAIVYRMTCIKIDTDGNQITTDKSYSISSNGNVREGIVETKAKYKDFWMSFESSYINYNLDEDICYYNYNDHNNRENNKSFKIERFSISSFICDPTRYVGISKQNQTTTVFPKNGTSCHTEAIGCSEICSTTSTNVCDWVMSNAPPRLQLNSADCHWWDHYDENGDWVECDEQQQFPDMLRRQL